MKTIFLFVATLFLANLALAQWGPDVRLTNNTGSSVTSSNNAWCIASNGDTLHVAWKDNRDGNNELYYKRSTDGGTTWEPDTRLTNNPSEMRDVSIAVSGNVVHIVWQDNRDGDGEMYYKRSLDSGTTWSADTRLTNAVDWSEFPSMAVSASGVHVVWTDFRDHNGDYEIYYKRSADGGSTWDPDTRLTYNVAYSGFPAVASSGMNVHVVWEDDRDVHGEIYYKRSVDGGVNWGADTRITNNSLSSWDPSVAVSNSVVHVVWMEDVNPGDYEIFYKSSADEGVTWTEQIRLSNNTAASKYPNCAVNGSDVNVVWEEMRDGQWEIYYQTSSDGGINWLGSEMRLTNSNGISIGASVCTNSSSINVVWNDTEGGNIEVYYKRYLPLPDSVYYERLFYLCKAWGHAKYYHTEIANGNINWDDELFKAIHGAKFSPTGAGFNDSLRSILNNAGTMGSSTVTLPTVPDSLNNNTDLSWIQNDIFSDTVRTLLDTIRSRFRPQPNIYVGGSGSQPVFDYDQLYYLESNFPTEEKRLLALFRYWNIINYFYPYKNIMDQNWDTTLVEFIPKIVESTDALTFSLNFKEFTTRINDSHSYFYSPTYQFWVGNWYPPFQVRYIENEMIITRVLPGIPDIAVGDVIKEIDGEDIYILRDSLRRYAHGSNDVYIESELNSIISWGSSGTSQIKLDDGTNIKNTSFNRNSSNYTLLNTNTTPAWRDTLVDGNCHFGIVDMGQLTTAQVGDMFTGLWETDAIIFDIRNYPQGTLWDIVNYIYPYQIHIANFTSPDITYPGRLTWLYEYIGSGTPTPYSGKIIILFDERTLSQAEYTCMGLEQFPGAIKIGSTTAAADGNVTVVYLPGKIRTYLTGLGTFYPDYSQTQRVGIIPDIEVQTTISGIRAGIDEVLEYALDCSLVSQNEGVQIGEVLLYPNPFSGKLNYELPATIDKQTIHFEIIDIFGRRIASIDKYSNKGEIDFPESIDGTCFIKITTEKETMIRKVIKY
jgi:carboxyl-terminal processing protease